MGTGKLEGKVDGLPAANGKDAIGKVTGGQLRQPPGKRGSRLRDEVVVTDIPLIQGFPQRLHDDRVPVSQIKDPAIAVAVDEPPVAAEVPDMNPFTPAWYKLHPILSKE